MTSSSQPPKRLVTLSPKELRQLAEDKVKKNKDTNKLFL